MIRPETDIAGNHQRLITAIHYNTGSAFPPSLNTGRRFKRLYLHPITGVLAHDLHDENVVRIPETGDLAIIDPYISIARRGTWAAIKLAEVGYPTPPDDPPPES